MQQHKTIGHPVYKPIERKFMCGTCYAVLDEDDLRTSSYYLDDLDRPSRCYESVCPCGGDPVPAVQCDRCDEYDFRDNVFWNDGICDKCHEELKKKGELPWTGKY